MAISLNRSLKIYLTTVVILLFGIQNAIAQLYSNQYRPPDQNWQQLHTDHFRILFPESAEDAAYRTARILELEYSNIQELVGGELKNFLFILNDYNDLSNGFVTPINFRSEVEVPPIKGKAMSPRSGDWLELVVPHELVHALHMNVNPNSLTSLIGLFSPDLRRSVHAAAPLGIFEGIAVEHESHGVVDGGGRGNYPYFTNRFSSHLMSEDPWSMGQLVHTSTATLPFNRHYIGGYTFTNWIQNEHGTDTFRDAIDFHYRWPFLGFGWALRQVTGLWPSQLYSDFESDMKEKENRRLSELEITTTDKAKIARITYKKGPVFHRPLWMDENTLLMHGRFYNSPTGFYRYDLESEEMSLLVETGSVEDYRYSLNSDEQIIYFADYTASTFYNNTFIADLFRFDISKQKKHRITKNGRVFAPAPGTQFLALQTDHYRNSVVELNPETGEISDFLSLSLPTSVDEIQFSNSHPDLFAAIIRKSGVQGLWIGNVNSAKSDLQKDPLIAFSEGSVFDLSWHPSAKKLLFSSDHTGTLNVYELDLEREKIVQLTNSIFNAFEASYSPNGDRIAYIIQQESRLLPAVLEQPDYYNRELPEHEWQPQTETLSQFNRPLLNREESPDQSGWERSSYSAGFSWLRPRTILPYYDEVSNDTHKIGLQLLSTDPLNSQIYSATLSAVQNRTWYDVDYTNSQFFPGFGINVFSEPQFPFLSGFRDDEEIRARFLLQQMGISFKIPFRFTLERRVRLSTFTITPEYRLSRARFFRLSPSDHALNDFGELHTFKISAVLNYRLRQFSRDVQPNSGWSIFAQTDYDLNSLPFEFEYQDYQFPGNFIDRKGFRAGVYRYLAPLSRWNQSLRIGIQAFTQSKFLKFDTQATVSNGFDGLVFPAAHNLGFFDTRYTIPLAYPDDGGFLIPVYLSNIYITLFTQTVGDLNQGQFTDILSNARTMIGAGIRTRVRLSNFSIDIGIGAGYEASRDQWSLIIGQF